MASSPDVSVSLTTASGPAYTASQLTYAITVTNRGPRNTVHLLPTLWFRNTWTWDAVVTPEGAVWAEWARDGHAVIAADHPHLGPMWLYAEGKPELLGPEAPTSTAKAAPLKK